MLLAKMKQQEVTAAIERGAIAILPVGTMEQHGYHLPVDTDEDTQDRLRAMVGLIFMSPSFLWR